MYAITGGLGFIGNAIVRKLRTIDDVTVIDNRHRVAPRIEDLADVPIVECDVLNGESLKRALRAIKPKAVVHMAALHYIPECNADPARTLRINVEGTMNVLNAAMHAEVPRIVFASSGAIYADLNKPLSETSPIAPVDIYGYSKLFGENLCRFATEQIGVSVVAARLFNNIGPRETNAHIVPEIVNQLRRGNSLRLGNIEPKRDYIYVDDTAEAIASLIGLKTPGFTEFNVATGAATSVKDLIGDIENLLGRTIKIEVDPARYRKADKLVQYADIGKIQTQVGWSPRIGLREGLRQLLEFEGLLK